MKTKINAKQRMLSVKYSCFALSIVAIWLCVKFTRPRLLLKDMDYPPVATRTTQSSSTSPTVELSSSRPPAPNKATLQHQSTAVGAPTTGPTSDKTADASQVQLLKLAACIRDARARVPMSMEDIVNGKAPQCV